MLKHQNYANQNCFRSSETHFEKPNGMPIPTELAKATNRGRSFCLGFLVLAGLKKSFKTAFLRNQENLFKYTLVKVLDHQKTLHFSFLSQLLCGFI